MNEAFTDYTERKVLENLLGIGGGLAHSSTYLGLIADQPMPADLEDPTYYHQEASLDQAVGYSRQGDIAWTDQGQVSGAQMYTNSNDIIFGPPESGWPTIYGIALYDAQQAVTGQKLWAYPFESPIQVGANEELLISADAIEVRLGSLDGGQIPDDLSDPAEAVLLRDVLAEGAPFSHSYVEVALFTADPGESGASGEVSDSGYSRDTISSWTPERLSRDRPFRQNDRGLSFGPFNSNHQITHVGFFTPGGTQLCSGPWSSPIAIGAGEVLTLPAEQLACEVG